MGADLNSLEGVIRHTKRTILYFSPLDDPAPIKRVWCLYEILTVATTEGNELTLGFSSSGKKEMYKIAAAFAKYSDTSEAKDVKALAKQPGMSQRPAPSHPLHTHQGAHTLFVHTGSTTHTPQGAEALLKTYTVCILFVHTGGCKKPLRSWTRRRPRRQCLLMQT